MKMKKSKVFLVGAGPGDPGLITVSGLQALEEADVILYDHLANPGLLGANPFAEKIYVGKKSGRHYSEQDEIIELLLKKAQEGNTVVRLKGGDPLIFGRGSEEALALVKAGIDFEIIPGITAANGATAYAGIPLTHRELVTQTVFVTAHESHDKSEAQVEWELLAKMKNASLVIYMGAKTIGKTVKMLMDYGMAPDMPAAVIENGTLPHQRSIAGTISNIADLIAEHGFHPPLITIIGNTITLQKELNMIKQRPLMGRRIIVTRARDQATEIYKMLGKSGASPIPFPVIKTGVANPPVKVREILGENYDWIVFTSANGVRYFFELLQKESLDSRALHNLKVAVVGIGTAERLREYGVIADFVPHNFNSEELVKELSDVEDLKNKKFLRIKGYFKKDPLTDNLEAMGAKVTPYDVYELTGDIPEIQHIEDVHENGADGILFTSGTTIDNFYKVMGSDKADELLRTMKTVVIGPMTATTLKEKNITDFVMAPKASVESMVDALIEAFAEEVQ
jgi:uroporphyrinogen III methyltransferase / synthase